MSDAGRKDFSQRAKEDLIPDSAKSTQDKVREGVTDTTDRITREAQSDQDKGAAQETYDKAQRMHEDSKGGQRRSSFVDKIKHTFGIGDH